MKNFVTLSGLISAGLFLTASPVLAASTTISTSSTTALSLSGGDSLTVASTGTLTVGSSSVAVGLKGSSSSLITIINSGTINQTSTGANAARAIRDNVGGLTVTITNNAGALIQAADADAIQMNVAGTSVTLNNHGTITSLNASKGGAQAVDWNALTSGSNTLNNYSTGLIQASNADSVRPGVNGVVTNDGTIKSTATTDTGSDGIDAQTNTGVSITNANTNTSGALIEGARHGITGGNTSGTGAYAMTIANNSLGTIQGDNGSGVNIDGINGNELVTITNAGTITGNGVTGDGDGVDVDGLVNLTNSGTIKSLNSFADTSEGVTVGGGTIVNSGTIEVSVTSDGAASGSVGRGITLAGVDKDSNDNPIPIQTIYANTTITNNSGGLIKGDSDSGIAILGVSGPTNFTVTITNNAGATIEGAGSAAVIDGSATAAGVGTASANNETVVDYGTIKADGSGKAISLGSGTNSVQILGGAASINGDISGGTSAGSYTLTIDPNAVTPGQSFSYSNVLSNFGSVQIKSGTVTLSGASTYSGPTTISGGTTYLNNSTGSGTGTGAVAISGGATLGGTGAVQPTGTNAITVNANGTLAAGGVQPAAVNDGSTNTANGSLRLDTTNFTPGNGTTPNAILNLTSANLTFALGSGNATGGSQVIVTGGVANTIAFNGTSTVTINDLVDTHLTLNQEYVLIDGDNTTYTGLEFGATSSLGKQIIGGLTLLAPNTAGNFFSEWYGSSQLYLVGDNIEIDAVPEPSVWGMILGGMAGLIFIQRCRRSRLGL
jgi:hypothetical protein